VYYFTHIHPLFYAKPKAMQHRGEMVEKAVRESGFPISELARRLHKSRRHVYNIFENPHVSIDEILQIGKIIHYDFSEHFTHLRKPETTLPEEQADVAQSVNYWKDKYIALLEKYNQLLEQSGKI
jgi:predicted transcriptional regulator